MNRRIKTIAVACALLSAFAGTGARAGSGTSSSLGSPDRLNRGVVLPSRGHLTLHPFKLKAGGQIDLSTGEITFAGQANHFGQFTASGAFDPGTGHLAGTLTAANGDSVNWSATFAVGSDGAIQANFEIDGGTGHYEHYDGIAQGPVTLDQDFMFTLDLEGTLSFIDQG